MDVGSFHLSAAVALLAIGVLGMIDGVIPLLPTRTAMIGVGVLAGDGNWFACPLAIVGTAGAFVSDNIAYWLGARHWRRLQPWVVRGPRSRRLWAWVEAQMRSRGTILVALARVLPGGPTPITLTAGSVGLPRRRFVWAAALGSALWSAYALSLGLFGNTVFGPSPLIALLVGAAVALGIDRLLRVVLNHRRR